MLVSVVTSNTTDNNLPLFWTTTNTIHLTQQTQFNSVKQICVGSRSWAKSACVRADIYLSILGIQWQRVSEWRVRVFATQHNQCREKSRRTPIGIGICKGMDGCEQNYWSALLHCQDRQHRQLLSLSLSPLSLCTLHTTAVDRQCSLMQLRTDSIHFRRYNHDEEEGRRM